MSKLLLSALLFAASSFAERVKYTNSPVLRLNEANTQNVRKVVASLTKDALVDKWSHEDIRINPENVAQVKMILAENSISWSTYIEDVQTLIDAEEKHMLTSKQVGANDFFTTYHTYAEILSFLDSYVAKYPQWTGKAHVGTSFEGRDIWSYNITVDSTPKPSIVLEFGIHAREWIATAIGPYIYSNLIDKFNSGDSVASTALKNYNWYFIPVVNPDGFEYTHTKDRMWRKTRSTYPGHLCVGVDPNRNWGDNWCSPIDCDTNPCSEAYAGPSAFSEIEVKSVANYLATLSDVKVFIDYHSYSQLFMSPYGYTTALPKDYQTQTAAGQAAVAAIKKSSGLTYDEGPIATIIYPASGSSADFGYNELNITYSYGVELRDQGQYGFLLPANQIIPCGEEIYAAMIALSTYISQQN